eukprot:gene6563-7609_t
MSITLNYVTALSEIAKLQPKVVNGLTAYPYLVTLSSQEEYTFVKTNLLINDQDNWYFGMRRINSYDLWTYGSGPEEGYPIFDAYPSYRCYDYCAWRAYEPNNMLIEDFVASEGLQWNNVIGADAFKYVVEWGGLEEPFIPSVGTAGGRVSITRLSNYNLQGMTVKVTYPNGTSVLITDGISSPNTLLINMPPGTGSVKIEIKDVNGKIFIIEKYKYQLPYIESIYPPRAGELTATITGDNFGSTVSQLSFKIMLDVNFNGGTDCTSVNIIVPHKVFTCNVPTAPTKLNQMLPVKVTVNGASQTSKNVMFYDRARLRMIMIDEALGSFTNQQNYISSAKFEGQQGYMGTVQNMDQMALIRTWFKPFDVNVIRLFQNIAYRTAGAPYAVAGWYLLGTTTSPVIDNNGNCNSSRLACSTFTASKVKWANGDSLSYTMSGVSDGTFIYTGAADYSGSLIFYGKDPECKSSVASPYLIPTSGGVISLNIINNGFTYTKRSFYHGGRTIPLKIVANMTHVDLTFTASAGAPVQSAILIEDFTVCSGLLMGFIKPTVSNISSIGTAGGKVTFTGDNFSNNPSYVSVVIGGVPCTDIALVSTHTSFTCNLPAGTGTSKNVVVTVAAQTPVSPLTFSYPPPTITSIVQTGNTLVINGTNFGANTTVASVFVPGALAVKSAAHTTLSVIIPFNTLNGPIVVKIDGQSTAPFDFKFTPSISSVTSPGTVGTSVTIRGSNINLVRQQNSVPTVTTITLTKSNGAKFPCTSPTALVSSTENVIECSLPSGSGTGHSLSLIIDGVASNTIPLAYQPPLIISYVQTGQLLAITGSNFATKDKLTSVLGTKAGTTNSISLDQTQLTISVPNGTLNDNLQITVDGQLSNILPYELAPVITNLETSRTFGQNITVTGAFFNKINGQGLPLTITATLPDNKACTNLDVINIEATQFVCTTPPGTGKNKPFEVKVGAKSSVATFSYVPPSISSLPVQNGNLLTITGFDFGNIINVVTVNFPTPTSITKIEDVNAAHTQLIVVSVPLNYLNTDISVTVDGQQSTFIGFAVTPKITQITSSPTKGDVITITGQYINSKRLNGVSTSASASVSGLPCTDLKYNTATSITCRAPAGSGSPLLTLEIDGSSSVGFELVYNSPYITSAVQSATTMILTGSNFGIQSSPLSIYFHSQLSNGKVIYDSETSIIAEISAFTLSSSLVLNVDGHLSNSVPYTLRPVLQSVTSTSTLGGDIIIGGYFLNLVKGDNTTTIFTVTIGGQPCTNVQQAAPTQHLTQIKCTASAGAGSRIPLIVTIDNLESNTIDFSYDAPTITSVIARASDNQVYVNGTSFGSDKSAISLTVGSTNVPVFQLSGDNKMITFDPPFEMTNDFIKVTVSGLQSNGKYMMLYPIITSVTKSSTHGSPVTIVGYYLNSIKEEILHTNILVTVDGQQCTNPAPLNADNNWLSCTAPPGTGVGHLFNLTIDTLSATRNTFSYLSPWITSTTQVGTTLSIVGSDFGRNNDKITLPSGFDLQSTTDNLIITKIPQSLKNGEIQLTVDGQSTSYNLLVVPIVAFATLASPIGGQITISGQYLNDFKEDGSETTITITVGNLVCATPSALSANKITCTLPRGSVIDGVINVTIDGQIGISTTKYTSLSPVVSESTGILYKVAGNVTITGQNFIEPLTVKIGSIFCESPVILGSLDTTIECKFSGLLPLSNDPLLVTVVAANLTGSAPVYRYAMYDCPGSPKCSGKGTCDSGVCICDTSYGGASCEFDTDTTSPSEPPTVANSATAIFNSDAANFTSSLVAFRELSASNIVVNTAYLNSSKWIFVRTWSDASSTSSLYNTNAINGQAYFSVSVVTTMFTAPNSSILATEKLIGQTNSVQHQITIGNYRFANPANRFQMIYSLSTPSSLDYNCIPSVAESKSLSIIADGQIRAITLDTPGAAFISRFTSRALLDNGTLGYLSVKLLSDIDPLIKAFNQTDRLTTLVSMTLPSFTSKVVVDPNFHAIRKPRPAIDCNNPSTSGSTPTPSENSTSEESGGGSKSKSWVIPVAVVLSIIGAALIAGGAYFIIKKKRQQASSGGGIKLKNKGIRYQHEPVYERRSTNLLHFILQYPFTKLMGAKQFIIRRNK